MACAPGRSKIDFTMEIPKLPQAGKVPSAPYPSNSKMSSEELSKLSSSLGKGASSASASPRKTPTRSPSVRMASPPSSDALSYSPGDDLKTLSSGGDESAAYLYVENAKSGKDGLLEAASLISWTRWVISHQKSNPEEDKYLLCTYTG